MSKTCDSPQDFIGNTPLVKLERLAKENGAKAQVFAKLEYLNPAGSVKDRVAKAIIDDAEKTGRLKPGGVIIEPTSGNTGIGIAAIAASRGYRAIIVMPESMSIERRKLIAAYGAEIVLTPASAGMSGAIKKAEELVEEIPGAILAGQFVNPANPEIHRNTTGPEIWRQTDGKIDIFVAGVGTGGTITGAGQYLKSMRPEIEIVAVEPAASPVLSGGKAGPHKIQGIGAGFIPAILDTSVYDQVIQVNDDDALATARAMGRLEGVLTGISGGAAIWAALQLARQESNRGKIIVAMAPDNGERYLSTVLYEN